MTHKNAELERIDNQIPEELKRKEENKTQLPSEDQSSFNKKLQRMKESGNSQLLKGNNQGAIAEYSKAVSFFETECKNEQSEERLVEAKATYVIVISNLAQAHLNNGDFQNAILQAKKALSLDKGNSKAYFRAGKAYK